MSRTPTGTLYGIGVGPGDPELVTLKAYRLLRSLPILYVPVARPGGSSYAWRIVERYLDPSCQEIIELVCAMREDPAGRARQWRAHAWRIADQLTRGRDVGFLTEGDPLLYSTFIHLVGALAECLDQNQSRECSAASPLRELGEIPGDTASPRPERAAGNTLGQVPAQHQHGNGEISESIANAPPGPDTEDIRGHDPAQPHDPARVGGAWPVDLSIVIVPGVSSIQAAAATARLPLADGDERLAVLPATADPAALRQALATFETIVLLKVSAAIDRVIDLLEEAGRANAAVFVSRAGRPDEIRIANVRSLRGQALDYFSLVIVRRTR